MKYCSKCGCELEDNVVNCPKCGNAVVSVQATASNQPAKTSAIGILAFVLSIIGFMTAFLYIGIFLDIAAIILAIITLIKSKNKPIKKGLPITGLVIAALSLLLMSFIYVNSFIATSSRVDNVKKLVNNIGDVTVESNEAITAAEEEYSKLTEEEKTKVDNYQTLEQAKKDYIEALRQDMLDKAEPLYPATIVEIEDEYSENPVRAKELYNGKIVTYMGVISSIEDNRIFFAYYTPNGLYKYVEGLDGAYSLMRVELPYNSLSNLNKSDIISCVGTLQVGPSLSINDAFLIDDSLNKYEH